MLLGFHEIFLHFSSYCNIIVESIGFCLFPRVIRGVLRKDCSASANLAMFDLTETEMDF
jgi:hypothetical protein